MQERVFSGNTDFAKTCSSNGGVAEWLSRYGACNDGTVIKMSKEASCSRHGAFRALLPADYLPPSTTTTVPITTASTAAAPTTAEPTTAPGEVAVAGVTDGDTLTVADGRRVRLAQVDAPETNECFGSQSTAALRALTSGHTVVLRRPSNGPEKDKYGRTLAEVFVGGVSVDEALVRDGAAEWYEEFADEDADLAQRLHAAEQEARGAGRGLWGACAAPPTTAATPPATAPRPVVTTAARQPSGDCDPAYPDVCIPAGPPDLDCGQIPYRRFRVLPPDPHGFDGNDNDGIGCER